MRAQKEYSEHARWTSYYRMLRLDGNLLCTPQPGFRSDDQGIMVHRPFVMQAQKANPDRVDEAMEDNRTMKSPLQESASWCLNRLN